METYGDKEKLELKQSSSTPCLACGDPDVGVGHLCQSTRDKAVQIGSGWLEDRICPCRGNLISHRRGCAISKRNKENAKENETDENVNDENVNDENVNDEVNSIPYQWWDVGLVNVVQLKIQGYDFYNDNIKKHGSTVFKMKLNDWVVMLCDHVSINDFYDRSKVKEDVSFGLPTLNSFIMRQYMPCIFQDQQVDKKSDEFLINFLRDIHKNITIEKVVELISTEFEKMEIITFTNIHNAEAFDFEAIIKRTVSNVMSFILLGENVKNREILYEWINRICDTSYPLDCVSMLPNERDVASKVIETIKTTKNMRELKRQAHNKKLNYERMIEQIVFTVGFSVTGEMHFTVISCLTCYLRLSERNKELLKNDADKFHLGRSYKKTLPTLEYINSFFLEVLRMHSPAPFAYGKAIKDFVLRSTSGSYEIKENDILCCITYLVQRDTNLYEEPNTFIPSRFVGKAEGFVGYVGDNKSAVSHHDWHRVLFSKVAKIFITFLIKCFCLPTETPAHTGKNISRHEGSDEPLKVLEFHYTSPVHKEAECLEEEIGPVTSDGGTWC